MSHTREANLLGAASLAVTDRMAGATGAAAAHGDSATAALASLTTYLDGASIDALRRPLGLTHSAAVRMVDRLAEAGLVARERGVDGRSVSVRLTPEGRAVGEGILARRLGALDDLLEVLDDGERATLTRLHEKLLAGLTGGGEDPGRICRLCDADACGHAVGRCPVTNAAAAARGS